MRVKVELTKVDLEKLILNHVRATLDDDDISLTDIVIETKSKQNFKSEWEVADFRASITVTK
jgi:hypothetical protein